MPRLGTRHVKYGANARMGYCFYGANLEQKSENIDPCTDSR